MDCRNVRKLLIAFLESELPAHERAGVESHLHHCADCRKERALLESAWAALDGLRAPAVSRDFTANLMAKIHEEHGKKPWGIALPEFQWPFAFPRLVPVLASLGLFVAVGIAVPYFLAKTPQPVTGVSVHEEVAAPVEQKAVVAPVAPAAKAVVSVPDDEIIRNLDVYENVDLLQNYALLNDFDVLQNPDLKVV